MSLYLYSSCGDSARGVCVCQRRWKHYPHLLIIHTQSQSCLASPEISTAEWSRPSNSWCFNLWWGVLSMCCFGGRRGAHCFSHGPSGCHYQWVYSLPWQLSQFLGVTETMLFDWSMHVSLNLLQIILYFESHTAIRVAYIDSTGTGKCGCLHILSDYKVHYCMGWFCHWSQFEKCV